MPVGRTRGRTGSALAPAGFVFPGGRSIAFALLALSLLPGPGPARADEAAPSPSYTRAYVALGAGGALTIASFFLAEQADRDYARYLAETDPARLEDAYQDARRGDRLAATTLIAGQAGLALGVYWRFLRRPGPAALTRAPGPRWSLAPRLGPSGSGVALDVRF